MVTRPILLVDQDEVLCEFWQPIVDACGKTKEDITTWETPEWAKEEFQRHMTWDHYVSLKPVPGALEALYELGKTWDIYVVTYTPKGIDSENLLEAKRQWLMLQGFMTTGKVRGVISTEHKHLIRGDVLIDDRLETCKKFAEAGGRAVVFDRPWNRGETPPKCFRHYSWESTVLFLNEVIYRVLTDVKPLLNSKAPKKEIKPRYDLLPPRALRSMAMVMANGLHIKGYPKNSWKEKYTADDHLQSLCRHHQEVVAGNFYNEEDGGEPHAAHEAVRACMYLEKWLDENDT